jgi:putative ABC transport system substrate-binding protein
VSQNSGDQGPRRRRFLAFLGAPLLWPIVASAQSADRVRRVGVVLPASPGSETAQLVVEAIQGQLRDLGWVEGSNLRLDFRWAPDGDPERKVAKELLDLKPDAILAGGDPVLGLREETRTVPIVFVLFGDPVGRGLVASLAHPGGNITGFTHYDAALAGKWVETLKTVAPQLTHATAIFGADILAVETKREDSWLGGIESAAASLGIRSTAAGVRDGAEIERAITACAAGPDGGLIVTPSVVTGVNRVLIIGLAAQYRLPAVYPFRGFAAEGGLISYGIIGQEHWRQGAIYVDRILRGAKPADLPVQQASKFELVINLKTAKTLGLTVPQSLLARADEVIE